ncbi:LppA family lipoprotein [Amycolatopsis thermoflava]|uniref:LppA family lipoprotein n=1 Tax=Amycolatopsis thermoflava TaxID=84480 RepID=UPI00366337E3
MPGWAQVVRWRPDRLQQAVGLINAEYNGLTACSDDLRGIAVPDGWSGPAAGAAMREARRIARLLDEWAAEIATARRAIGDVGDAITGVVHGVEEAEALATRYGFRIGEDGAVTDPGMPAGVPEDQRETVARDRAAMAMELADRVGEVLRQAEDIDSDFCLVLDRTSPATRSTSIRRAHRWQRRVRRVTPLGRCRFWRHHRTGIRPATRRGGRRCPATSNSFSSGTTPSWSATGTGSPRGRATRPTWPCSPGNATACGRSTTGCSPRAMGACRRRCSSWASRPSSTRSTRSTRSTHLPDGTVNPERQLLSLDLTGRAAKAAIAHGDVATARHVAVFTPGMNSAVDQNMAGYVNDMEHVQRGAEKLARLRGDGGSVATVTWLGYEPPAVPVDGKGMEAGKAVADLLDGSAAEDGAEKLARFNEGINASRPDDPHLTALGHSYGSLTTGIALQRNTGVDDVVFFGSPGISDTPDLPVNPVGLTNELSSLQVPSGHAYNLSAEGDPIAHDVPQLGRYGSSPATMPGMQQLSTHEAISPDGQRLVAAHGHSEYRGACGRHRKHQRVQHSSHRGGHTAGGDNGGTVKVLRRTAVLVALAVITASGCSGNDPSGYLGGPTTRNGMNADQQFQELMQRPTTEEVVARYRLVLDQLRDELTSTFGVQPWTEAADGVRNFNGCARAFPAVHLWDATEQSLADLVSDATIPEDRRSEARQFVVDFAARKGFDRIKTERGPGHGDRNLVQRRLRR